MIECETFYRSLRNRGIGFFTGVPDSTLSDMCTCIDAHCPRDKHIVAANEGNAVALASGYYLATGKRALVYMQNSGQGNALNPLASLADPEVYGIPMLLLIGWRGEPGVPDEPQHIKQGKITLPLLNTLNIPHRILPRDDSCTESLLDDLLSLGEQLKSPVALIARKGTFLPYVKGIHEETVLSLTRERAIQIIIDQLEPSDLIVSTTGKASRELYAYREIRGDDHARDFLTVGSMGHASSIALGVAIAKPERQVFCLDGDGSALMHLGAMAIIGSRQVEGFKHIILNNMAHDSVGGIRTEGGGISFAKIARICGYKEAFYIESEEQLCEVMNRVKSTRGPLLLEIRVRTGSREDLGRPKLSPTENKISFMAHLSQ